MRIVASARTTELLMVKPLRPAVLDGPLEERDILYWHGDLF